MKYFDLEKVRNLVKVALALSLVYFVSPRIFAFETQLDSNKSPANEQDSTWVVTKQQRFELLKKSTLSTQQTWFDPRFGYNESFNLVHGPELSKSYEVLRSGTLNCEAFIKESRGKTPKFYCYLTDMNGKYIVSKSNERADVKVRYQTKHKGPSSSVVSEVAATRLLWSMGYAADRVFPLSQMKVNIPPTIKETFSPIECLPPQRIDSNTSNDEVICGNGNAEKNFKGKKIELSSGDDKEGFTFSELQNAYISIEDKELAYDKLAEFDAFVGLAMFLRHADSKRINHRLVCEGEVSKDRLECVGQIRPIIQDLGVTFGQGATKFSMDGMTLEKWAKSGFFKKKGDRCVGAKLSYRVLYLKRVFGDRYLDEPELSEEGRRLLLKKLDDFSYGEVGYNRLLELFDYARVDLLGDTSSAWANAFLDRVEQLRNLGECRSLEQVHSLKR
jgi:hypothetical protein